MKPEQEQAATPAAMPHAVIEKKTGLSLIWVVPLIAVIIAAGLIYKAVTEKGPTITITFKTAEGIEPGKTQIKHKDVVIGQVNTVRISQDLKNVIVTAQLVKEAKGYLTAGTKFWVVRARFSGGMVSGIGTLLSGSYIAIDPNLEGEARSHFKGLELPPVVTSDLPGRHFKLKAPRLGSLAHGSPVYFKGIKVGQVVGYRFSDHNENLDIRIFINAPYDKNVNGNSRFWLSSGLDMVLDTQGVRIDTESLVSMMIGGLAFANPDTDTPEEPAREDHAFQLFDSSKEAFAVKYYDKDEYLIKFDNSVRGLSIGAPVEFRGFPFGQVVDIALEMDWAHNRVKIPVRIEVEPERIKQLMKADEPPEDALDRLVEQGLRAQLTTGNFITGSKYVTIDFFKSAEPASLMVHGDIIEIPTVPAPLDELTNDLTTLIDRLSRIPMEEIGTAALNTIKSLEQTSSSFKKAGDSITDLLSLPAFKESVDNLKLSLEQIRRLTARLEQQVPASLEDVSQKTMTTLDDFQKLAASDSDVAFELKRALQEFTRAAQSVSRLADQLERHPESLLQGKGKE